MAYTTEAILRDMNGDPIPQIWDAVQGKFVPYSGIPEHLWLSSDSAPTLGASDRALGVEVNTSTHAMTVKYWNGTAWGDIA